MYVITHQKTGLTQKRYLSKCEKLLQALMSPPPSPFCNILTNEKNIVAKFINLLLAFISPPLTPNPTNIVILSQIRGI